MASRAQARKADLNEATIQELVEVAGLKPATAEAVVKRRDETGPFESLEAVADVPGVGKAALDQVRDAFNVSAEAGKAMMEKAAEQTESVAEETRAGAKKAVSEVGDNVVEGAKRTQSVMADMARATSEGGPVVQHLSLVWTSYWVEQLQDNFKLTSEIYTCRDMQKLFELQAGFAQAAVRRFEDRMRTTVDLMAQGGIQAVGRAREQATARA